MSERIFFHQWKHVGGIVASFTTEGEMPDDVWERMMRDLETLPITGYLAASEGAVNISSTQRKLGVHTMNARDLPTAVVSESRVVVGIATAASWLGGRVKAFSWKDIQAATKYLGASHAQQIEIVAAVNQLREKAVQQLASSATRAIT